MLPNERFALECLQRYAENGDIIDATNGQFAHCPQPERYGDKGYYLTWGDHQHQGLLQSRDIGECCFFSGDVKKWLLECDPIPENYFELWDIYEEYSSDLGKKANEKRWGNMTQEKRQTLSESIKESYWSKSEQERRHQLRGLRRHNEQLPYEVMCERARIAREKYKSRLTEEEKIRRAEKARQDNNKAMEVTFPNDRVGVYPSGKIASMFTGIPGTTLRNWARNGLVGKYGKNKGYSAKYL
jgi:hypothetical protein